VGRVLHDGLLQTSASVFYTSATLGNALGDKGTKGIEWATGYLYLDPEKRFKHGFYLPAAFDYKNKTKVFLCDDTPSIHDQHFVSSTLQEIVPLMKDLSGRSLLLFSSKKRFETAREYLLEKLDGHLPLFIQGMGLNVVEDFKNTEGGVLMGMESFGEGIDIPGEKLQFVFIDKIPDLRMDYVIQKRRDFYEANLGNEFTDYYLSTRARSLHQKLGRLLRTENDHGGVIIVDSRVKKWKGRTMDQLVKLMEPYQLERGSLSEACESVRDFILDN
jgi:ATP-dependent DNA helicase DinG